MKTSLPPKPIYFRLLGAAAVLLAGLWIGLVAIGAPLTGSSSYTNPVIDRNFPDPSVILDRGTYYAYSTNSSLGNLPCAQSTDLVHWSLMPDAMPDLPPWANRGRTWAPNVRDFVPGKSYIAFFTARDRATNEQAVGVAAGSSPTGPFISTATAPLINQRDLGGSIDPSCFEDDDGTRYVVWKNDGNSRGLETWIWIQKLSPDGLNLVGTPTQLTSENQGWEGNLIEAPTLWKHNGKYYLFYSANGYNSCNYAIGYATSPTLLGPYTKPRTAPWVSSTADVCGPGGEDLVTAKDGTTWMAYHSWEKGRAYRSMNVDPLTWVGDRPVLVGPSRWAQAMPVPVAPAAAGQPPQGSPAARSTAAVTP